MSRRAIRKLQGDHKYSRDLERQGCSESDDTDISPTHRPAGRGPSNPYEVLDQDRTPSDNEAKEDDDIDGDAVAGEQRVNDQDPAQMTDSLKRKKKKKKKKARETKEEDVDAVAHEVKQMLGELDSATPAANSVNSSTSSHNLFSIDYRHLQAENELRRIFGSKVVQAEAGKRRTRSRGHIRTSKLVTPRHNWPQVGKSGLSMTLVDTKDKLQYFKFEHNANYQTVQFQFLEAVESLNPDNIVSIINMHPYHIDASLQLSDIMRLGEDAQMAAELVERALYCFESSFHSLFNIAQGNCRVDYRYDENRSFYISIFKHLTYLGQRGCHRTALEFCKVLFNLDPDGDPLCVALMIDFHAIKAKEYAYLIQMFDELEPQRNLSQLPNFAFSLALAKFHLCCTTGEDEGLRAEADVCLQNALLAFPALLRPLLDKCNVQSDARVAGHTFFGLPCQASHPEALMTLIQLYVGRSYHLWKEPEVLVWLELNVNLVLDRVDRGDPVAVVFEQKRKLRYQGMPHNIYRHIIMSEIKDATASLPPDLANKSMLSFDPLPPPDNISSYTRPARPTPTNDLSMLQAMFRSLFPSYAIEEAQRQQNPHAFPAANAAPAAGAVVPEPEAAGGAEGGGSDTVDFRRSVTSLLDAMRDLLTNIHFPEVGQDGDADDSDIEPDN